MANTTRILRQSTSRTLYFLLSHPFASNLAVALNDTTITGDTPTSNLCKSDGTQGSTANSVTEVGGSTGIYSLTLTSGETDTLGDLIVVIHANSNNTLLEIACQVVTATFFDGGTVPSDPWATAVPGAYSSGTAGYILGGHLGAVASVTAPVTAGTVSDKTGYALSSTGLNSVSVTAPTTVATTFPGMLVQLWRRMFKKVSYDTGSGAVVTYADDGSTAVTTQTLTNVSGTQTQGTSS